MGIADSQCVHEDGSTPTDPDGIRPWDQGRRPVFRTLRLDDCGQTPEYAFRARGARRRGVERGISDPGTPRDESIVDAQERGT